MTKHIRINGKENVGWFEYVTELEIRLMSGQSFVIERIKESGGDGKETCSECLRTLNRLPKHTIK